MLNSRLCYWYFLANFFPRTFVSSIYQHNYWINVKKQGQNWLFKIIVFVNALVKCQNTKQGFEIHELRSVFGKLRIEISNSIENCKMAGGRWREGVFFVFIANLENPSLIRVKYFFLPNCVTYSLKWSTHHTPSKHF